MRLKSIGVLRGYAMGKTQLNKIADNIEHEVEEALEFERSENAKLRNLVHILCHCMQIHKECDDCRLNGAKGELAFDPLCACDGLHELLRELGVEVDG